MHTGPALALRHFGWRSWRGPVRSRSRRRSLLRNGRTISKCHHDSIMRAGPQRHATSSLIWTGAPSPEPLNICSALSSAWLATRTSPSRAAPASRPRRAAKTTSPAQRPPVPKLLLRSRTTPRRAAPARFTNPKQSTSVVWRASARDRCRCLALGLAKPRPSRTPRRLTCRRPLQLQALELQQMHRYNRGLELSA